MKLSWSHAARPRSHICALMMDHWNHLGRLQADQLLPASAPPEHQTFYERGSLESSGFSSGLCDCSDESCDSCCLAYCCPCHAHGLLCHDMSGHYWVHCLSWLICATCPPAGLHPLLLLGTFTRVRLRDKYGLPTSASTFVEGMNPVTYSNYFQHTMHILSRFYLDHSMIVSMTWPDLLN